LESAERHGIRVRQAAFGLVVCACPCGRAAGGYLDHDIYLAAGQAGSLGRLLRALVAVAAARVGYRLRADYSGYENWIERVDWWNYLCKHERANWQRWAQDHLLILRSIALTPETELAEQLLGLEGSAPMNPDKIIALPASAAQAGASRAEHVLEQLLTPLAYDVARIAQTHSPNVVLQSADEQQLTELQALWRRLKLPDLVNIRMAAPDENTTNGVMIGPWFKDGGMPDFVLLLACQLHEDGTDPSRSEVAVAMLLASQADFARYRGKLKPQARLFRLIFSAPDKVFESLTTLLAGEQPSAGRIRHLWLSRLPRDAHHATVAAVKDAGLQLSAHDVDDAIGKLGPVNALPLQALAAQMYSMAKASSWLLHRAGKASC
jgi:hypothetical protein